MKKDDFTDYEEVLSTHNAGDQALIKSLLDSEGITYFIQGEYVAPYLYHALPLRVMVKKEEVEKAKEILWDIKLSFSYGGGYDSENDIENKEKE